MSSVCCYERIVIIGYGKIANDVLNYICMKKEIYRYNILFIEHEIYPLSIARQICEKNNVDFLKITDKKELTYRLEHIESKTLIVSVCNNYLFPGSLVNKENLKIINFHNRNC